MMAKRVVCLGAVRTPFGRFGGTLKDVPAPRLSATLIRHLLDTLKLPPTEVDEVIIGQAISAGAGMNPARQAAVFGGLPYEVPAYTVNRVCGSGLQAIWLGVQAIRLGEARLVFAGGMENMSMAPYALPQARWGARMNHVQLLDLLIHDGLWDVFYGYHMGVTAENLVRKYGISREEQDQYALRSHQKAVAAQQAGLFKNRIVAVDAPGSKGETLSVNQDEVPRPDTSLEKLSQLPPAFLPDGTITAGNASAISDGAAMVVLADAAKAKELGIKPLAEFVDFAVVGVDPSVMGLGPVGAIRALLKKQNLPMSRVDLWEINEAFAAQVLAVCRELDLPQDQLNIHGGAIALGHPLGASGARIVVDLIHNLVEKEKELGIAALCIGGGMGLAALILRET